MAEKVIGGGVIIAKETSKELDSYIHVGDTPAVQPERKRIPFPVNPHRKSDVKKIQNIQRLRLQGKKVLLSRFRQSKSLFRLKLGRKQSMA